MPEHFCRACDAGGTIDATGRCADCADWRPTCVGQWLSGSGGHRVHGHCGRDADWWHPDDVHAYCAEHVPVRDLEAGFYVPVPKEWR